MHGLAADGSAVLLELVLVCGLGALLLLSLHLALLTTLRLVLPPVRRAEALPRDDLLPKVLVQLPLYNEGALVERALASIAALDWPQDRLVIQVLDDSNDGSLAESQRAVDRLRRRGGRVTLHHRACRDGFKAGALAAGLARCDAPFVAVFDADFMPTPDFLRRTLSLLLADSGLGHVQARWLHANRTHSRLTRAQARLLDGHFLVEQEVRQRLGLPIPFNGTCGVWRSAAIHGAGGWSGDTLTEDLDLSLRARFAGWRSAYLCDLGVPGEVPEQAPAWRGQQFRWTKGFVECLLKLARPLWQSRLPRWQKLLISLQLSQPTSFLIGCICVLAALPFIAGVYTPGPALAGVALVTTSLGLLGPLSMLIAGALLKPDEPEPLTVRLRDAATALALTTGLLLSNGRAVLEAFAGLRSPFVRTPKGPGASGANVHKSKGVIVPATAGIAARLRPGLAGVPELLAGSALLVFTLLKQPLALPALALTIGGLVSVGVLLRRGEGGALVDDAASENPIATEAPLGVAEAAVPTQERPGVPAPLSIQTASESQAPCWPAAEPASLPARGESNA